MSEAADSDDRELARLVTEIMILDPLDSGEEPVEVERKKYDDMVGRIEGETGLSHPKNYSLIEYPSGQQLLHDLMSGRLDEMVPGELEEDGEEDFELSELKDELKEFGKHFGGSVERNEDEYRIMYVPSVIERGAPNIQLDRDELETGVMIEEGIHAAQVFTYPETMERRHSLNPETEGEELVALMTAVEGHANFYTERMVPGYTENNDQLDFKNLNSLLGTDVQVPYDLGPDFISELHERGGTGYTRLPFEEPPKSMKEIENPEIYIERVE